MKVAVVIRQLPGHMPVAMAVITDPGDSVEIDDLDHYFESRGEKIIEDFKKQFVEFKEAWFDVQILETIR